MKLKEAKRLANKLTLTSLLRDILSSFYHFIHRKKMSTSTVNIIWFDLNLLLLKDNSEYWHIYLHSEYQI